MIRQHGFTLTETVIFILVLAIGLTGIITLSTTVSRDSSLPLIRERTLVIAHAYMDEIISKRWDENTPVGGGCVDTDTATANDSCTLYCSALSDFQCSRSKCTLTAPSNCQAANVVSGVPPGTAEEVGRNLWDDLDDYDGYNNVPDDINGAAIPGYADYNARVLITQAALTGIPANADVRRIEVRVTSPLGETLSLVSYRVNF